MSAGAEAALKQYFFRNEVNMSYGVVASNLANALTTFNQDADTARQTARSFWVELQNTMQAAGKLKIVTLGANNEPAGEVADFDGVQISRGFVLDFVLRINVRHINVDLYVSVQRLGLDQGFRLKIGDPLNGAAPVFDRQVDIQNNSAAVSAANKAFEDASKKWVCDTLEPVTIRV